MDFLELILIGPHSRELIINLVEKNSIYQDKLVDIIFTFKIVIYNNNLLNNLKSDILYRQTNK